MLFFFGAQCLTGIQEMNVWNGACDYDVDHHDIDPANDYYRLSMGALLRTVSMSALRACTRRKKQSWREREGVRAGEIPKAP